MMNDKSDDLNYHELKAELQILQGKIEDLNARLKVATPPAASRRKRAFTKIAAFRWQLAIGFLVLAGAVAQTSDPINIGPDGNVRMGKSLDVAGKIKAGLAIEAGNSDIYFTKTDHVFTAAADVAGKAAIENSSNYNGLMILGRTTAAGRIVRMWDRIGVGGNDKSTVAAPLDVKGEIRGMPWRSAEYKWTESKPVTRTKMTKTDHSVCFLTAVTGYFFGGGERVEIVADPDGYWYLTGKSQTRDVSAVARCIGAPDDSW